MELKFKPSEEAMDQLRNKVVMSSPKFGNNKLELLLFCLSKFDGSDKYRRYDSAILQIKVMLSMIISDIKDELKRKIYYEWKDSPDKSFTLNLYDSSLEYEDCEDLKKIECKYSHEEVEAKVDYYVESLSILHAIVETPDYFDDSIGFSRKHNELNEIIEDFVGEAGDIARNEIVDEFKEFIVCEECEDGE